MPDRLPVAYGIGYTPLALTGLGRIVSPLDRLYDRSVAVHPAGVNIAVAVYNSSEWSSFVAGGAPAPLYSVAPTYTAEIVYSPDVTDTYYFVFTNPYAPSTHLTVGVYIATLYNSNVANDGFA